MTRLLRRVLLAPRLLVMIRILVLLSQIVARTSTDAHRDLDAVGLPGLAIGIDVDPATPGRSAYLEVWCSPHTADDILILVAMPVAPALPHAPQRGTETIEAEPSSDRMGRDRVRT